MKRIIGVEYDPNFLPTLQGILVVDIVDPPAVSPTRHLLLGDGIHNSALWDLKET